MLADYTSIASVRSILGTTERELPNEFLSDELFEMALLDELVVISETVAAGTDLAGEFLALPSSTTTSEEAEFFRGMKLFASHFIALKCLSAVPELSPVMITDSKATMKKDKADAAARIAASASKYRRRLQEVGAAFLGLAAPAAPVSDLLSVSSPGFDPVVGA